MDLKRCSRRRERTQDLKFEVQHIRHLCRAVRLSSSPVLRYHFRRGWERERPRCGKASLEGHVGDASSKVPCTVCVCQTPLGSRQLSLLLSIPEPILPFSIRTETGYRSMVSGWQPMALTRDREDGNWCVSQPRFFNTYSTPASHRVWQSTGEICLTAPFRRYQLQLEERSSFT